MMDFLQKILDKLTFDEFAIYNEDNDDNNIVETPPKNPPIRVQGLLQSYLTIPDYVSDTSKYISEYLNYYIVSRLNKLSVDSVYEFNNIYGLISNMTNVQNIDKLKIDSLLELNKNMSCKIDELNNDITNMKYNYDSQIKELNYKIDIYTSLVNN
jgi:hypothetical protein